LRVERVTGEAAVCLVVTAQGGAIDLQDAAWERLISTGNANGDTSYRPTAAPLQVVRAWFGNPALREGETRRSAPIAIPPAVESLVWKVVGKDAQGNTVTACCSSAALAVARAPQ
jgi:hypothetical protein